MNLLPKDLYDAFLQLVNNSEQKADASKRDEIIKRIAQSLKALDAQSAKKNNQNQAIKNQLVATDTNTPYGQIHWQRDANGIPYKANVQLSKAEQQALTDQRVLGHFASQKVGKLMQTPDVQAVRTPVQVSPLEVDTRSINRQADIDATKKTHQLNKQTIAQLQQMGQLLSDRGMPADQKKQKELLRNIVGAGNQARESIANQKQAYIQSHTKEAQAYTLAKRQAELNTNDQKTKNRLANQNIAQSQNTQKVQELQTLLKVLKKPVLPKGLSPRMPTFSGASNKNQSAYLLTMLKALLGNKKYTPDGL